MLGRYFKWQTCSSYCQVNLRNVIKASLESILIRQTFCYFMAVILINIVVCMKMCSRYRKVIFLVNMLLRGIQIGMLAYILVEIYRLNTIRQTVYNPNHIGLGHSGHVYLEKASASGHFFFVIHWTVDTPANYSWEKQ